MWKKAPVQPVSGEKNRRKIKDYRLLFLAKLDMHIQYLYKIDKKCEKNNSILNKTFFNGMIGGMNNLYSIYLCKRGNL